MSTHHHVMPAARTLPRAGKRAAGRTHITETPLSIRTHGVKVPPGLRARMKLLLGTRLARFGPRIEHIGVRFEDVNGPRGGVDTVCRLDITVSGRPNVVVQARSHDPAVAMRRAVSSAEKTVSRALSRRGLPVHAPTRGTPARAGGTRRAAAPDEKATPRRRSRSRTVTAGSRQTRARKFQSRAPRRRASSASARR
jgi:hypothetical protein